MGYADALLSDGERIIVREQAALVRLRRRRALAILAVVIAVILARPEQRRSRRTGAGTLGRCSNWIAVVLFFGGIAVARLDRARAT